MKKKIKNILVVSLSNIGDVILTLPVVNTLKANFPEASLSLVVGPKAVSLFFDEGDNGRELLAPSFFQHIVIYDKKGSMLSQIKFLWSLWQLGRFDLVIDLRNTLIPFLVAARQFNSPLKRPKGLMRMREKHLRVLDFLKLDLSKSATCPLFGQKHSQSLAEILERQELSMQDLSRAVVFSPGARHWFKTWPPLYFAALCEQLAKAHPELLFIVCGSGEEKEAADTVVSASKVKMINLAGKLSLPEFACLLFHCRLLVSNDSAAMHIAHYLQVPVVAIFGPTNPEKYGFVSEKALIVFNDQLTCRPCEKATCPTQRECLTELPVTTVLAKAEQLL